MTDVTGGTYVDNAFAAPGADGCILTLFGYPPSSLDEEIDTLANLPSEAGSNSAVLNFDTESVSAETVYP